MLNSRLSATIFLSWTQNLQSTRNDVARIPIDFRFAIIIELLFLIRSAADGNNGRLFSGAIHRRAIANRGRVFARIAHLRLACTDGVPEIAPGFILRSEEHTSELQSPDHLVCRLLLAQ